LVGRLAVRRRDQRNDGEQTKETRDKRSGLHRSVLEVGRVLAGLITRLPGGWGVSWAAGLGVGLAVGGGPSNPSGPASLSPARAVVLRSGEMARTGSRRRCRDSRRRISAP